MPTDENVSIAYSLSKTLFGKVLIASTAKGVVYMGFVDGSEAQAFKDFKKEFPNTTFVKKADALQKKALSIFSRNVKNNDSITLFLKGTDFQIKVWKELLKIPFGKLSTYGSISKKIKNPKANRAVGSAVGHNPIAYFIPCHRVIQSSGAFGKYHWGTARKKAIHDWEVSKESAEIRT